MENKGLKILDCTLRDGGLTNASRFSIETVRAIYGACCAAGLDYVELGYRNSKKFDNPDDFGPWRFCEEALLQDVVADQNKGHTKISLMQDAHRASSNDILPRDESVVDLIRIASYVRDLDKAVNLSKHIKSMGYECSINIMAISTEPPQDLISALHKIQSETQVDMVYIVDSYGALYPNEVTELLKLFREKVKDKCIGVHFHNSQQLAFANSLESMNNGADIVDGTLFGLGRGSGNCPTELLLNYIKSQSYNIEPLLEVIQSEILPTRDHIHWGYHIPYMLLGSQNVHPKEAMDWMQGEQRDNLLAFYNKIKKS